jgi:probable F420-dependent oxidoreductase
MQLSKLGIWTTYHHIGEERAGEAARIVEQFGYGTFWLGGSPRLSSVRALLEATERLIVGTAIVNVWQHEPADLAREHAELTRDFPDRLLLGIGIGHPEATGEYERPLSTMRSYLDGLDQPQPPVPVAERCLAALGPKMLQLSGERTRGAIPYFTPVEHTRFARELLGESALIAPELACVLDTDRERARAKARTYAKTYLGLRNYTSNLLRFDFSEQDLADGGSDRLIDAVVPQGTAREIAAVVQAHLDAGADHVCLQPVGVDGVPQEEWSELAAAVIG